MHDADARFPLIAGSILGFFSVAAGAFGAHALKDQLTPDLLAIFDTGVRYAMFHSTALLVTGLLARLDPGPGLRRAATLFTLGVVLFTGSLWLLALTGHRWLGAVTPLGGVSFLLGWAALGRHAAGIGRSAPAHLDETPQSSS